MEGNIYFGDAHMNIHTGPMMAQAEDIFREARGHLDFFPVAYYPFKFYTMPQGLRVESIGHRPEYDAEWQRILELCREFSEEGRFVCFPGYEWHGDRIRYGDHNVYYKHSGPLSAAQTLPQLYQVLREHEGIAIPHHTAYQPGQRGKDWDFHDDELSPCAEIFSSHGSSEGCGTPYSLYKNSSMGPRTSGGSVQDGLARGYRLGIICSGDNHGDFPGVWGNGLAAICAPELSRDALWRAIRERRVYGVTGDRILLSFSCNGAPMGSVIPRQRPLRFAVSVVCWDELDRIELLRNNRVFATHCHQGTWQAPEEGRVRLRLRVECGWGPAQRYGYHPTLHRFQGEVTIGEGRIVRALGCFTMPGQRIAPPSERACRFSLASIRERNFTPTQALLLELDMPLDAPICLDVNGKREQFTAREALSRGRIVAFVEEAQARAKEVFGLNPEDIENPRDSFWHNAHKIKIHRAVPESAYCKTVEFVDDDPPQGWSWYYLRISQVNGQMAWSSPIFVSG